MGQGILPPLHNGRRISAAQLRGDRGGSLPRSGRAPESLDAISPEEKHQIYKTLRMKVLVNMEGTVAVETVSGKVTECDQSSVNTGALCL